MAADGSGRRLAWALLAALVAGFVIVVAVLTPWDVAGTEAPRPSAGDFFTTEQIARSAAFHDAIRWPSRLGLLVGLVVVALVGFSPLGRRLVDWSGRRARRWWLRVVLLVVAVSLLQLVARLPFSVWARTINIDYGLSTNTWPAWVVDVLKAWGISTALTCGALLALVALARRFTRRWYLPAAGAAATLVVGLSFAYPVVFEPVFNEFTSMPDSALRTSLLQLADDDGVAVSDVLVADASRRTTSLNAYVSGFGSTKRIVVYDNLVDQAPPDEVELIVAHELSHAKHDDVLVGTLEGAIGAGIAMVALFLLLGAQPVRRPLRVGSAGDPAVVAVVIALAAFGMVLAAPVQNTISRQIEARADAHALELTDDPDTFIAIQQRLSVANISELDPDPVWSFWFGSHPTSVARIAMALDYRSAHDAAPDRPR